MFKSIKYLLLLAFTACFVTFGAYATECGCGFDDQGEFNTDEDCGTAAADCEWTFQLVCPASITCESADLGTFCIGEDIEPTGDNGWVTFMIGGEVGRLFALTVNVSETAENDEQEPDADLVVNGLTWKYSTNNGTTFTSLTALNMDADDVDNAAFKIMATDDYANGSCVDADESGYILKVRPTEISTTNATAAGVYSIHISLGVDFGYSL